MAVPISEIEAAHRRIRPHVHRTPVLTCATIDEICGGRELFFKSEHLQRIGAFKIRGAVNAVMQLKKERGDVAPSNPYSVVTHSSGNHAQALALAGKMLGVPVHVIMPENAPTVKRNAVEHRYGAKVYPCKPIISERQRVAQEVMDKVGGVFIHPYDNRHVQAGQGTCGLELMQQTNCELDAVVIAIGGGGMFTGIASACRALKPGIKIIGAEPANASDAHRGFVKKELQTAHLPGHPNTMADGLLTLLAESTYAGVSALADHIVTVDEAEISRALRLIFERMKQVVEPSAAVPLAAVLSSQFPKDPAIKKVGVVLCGGNINLDLLPGYLGVGGNVDAKL